jgi:transposase
MAGVEVLSGPERRRRWSIEQKQAIVVAAFEPGAVVRDVARQADVTPSLIYRWRRDLRAAANGFAQVLVAPAGDGLAIAPVPAIEIDFAGNAHVRIPASVSPALASAVVEALARR